MDAVIRMTIDAVVLSVDEDGRQEADDDSDQDRDGHQGPLQNLQHVREPPPDLGELLVHALPELVSVIVVLVVGDPVVRVPGLCLVRVH